MQSPQSKKNRGVGVEGRSARARSDKALSAESESGFAKSRKEDPHPPLLQAVPGQSLADAAARTREVEVRPKTYSHQSAPDR